jgi:hypothetical protein
LKLDLLKKFGLLNEYFAELKVRTPMKKSGCTRCGNITTDKYKPFCSKRCSDLDLGNWMNGSYAIPSNEEPNEADIEEIIRHLNQPQEDDQSQ